MQINPQIFREYDVRGVVDTDLSEEFAYLLGRAYGTLARENQKNDIAVGHDCRLTSRNYAEALMRGINDEGIDTTFTGMGPTPQLYFALFSKGFGGGIQVTGSHNPANMNGYKLCLGQHTLSGSEIKDLQARTIKAQSTKPTHPGKGKRKELLIQQEYIQALVQNCKPHMGKKKVKVVVDAGNGVGGIVGPSVLRQLGVEVIELFCEPDGRFPNHHPDPTEIKNIQTLIAKVKETKADLGIGWDGDADRIGAVDENGAVIFGDMLLLIYGRKILQDLPNATILGDVKCSSHLFQDLSARGANAIMWKTGHSLIKNKLKETNGALAGEMSGHIFFKHRYYGFDDAIYASCRLVEIVSQVSGPTSSLLADLPKVFSTPEIRVECAEEIKFKVAERAQKAFPEYKVTTIDGVRIEFPKGWGLVRASNTQPVLVLRFEAESPQKLEEYQGLVTNRIREIEKSLGR